MPDLDSELAELRTRLGAAARERAQREWSVAAAADAYARAMT